METTKKMTLVSIGFQGKTTSVFIELPIVNGKPYLSTETFNEICRDLAGIPELRGLTISIS